MDNGDITPWVSDKREAVPTFLFLAPQRGAAGSRH